MKVSNVDLGSDLKPRSVTIKVGGVYYVNLGLVPHSHMIGKRRPCIVIGHYNPSNIYTVVPCTSEKDTTVLSNTHTIYEPVSIVNGVQSLACINQIVAVDEEAIDEYIGVLKDIKLSYIISRAGKYLMGNDRINEMFGYLTSLRNNIEKLTNENEKLKNELIELKKQQVKEIPVSTNDDVIVEKVKKSPSYLSVDTEDFGDGCVLVDGVYYVPERFKLEKGHFLEAIKAMSNDDVINLFHAISNIGMKTFARLIGAKSQSLYDVKHTVVNKCKIDLSSVTSLKGSCIYKVDKIVWTKEKNKNDGKNSISNYRALQLSTSNMNSCSEAVMSEFLANCKKYTSAEVSEAYGLTPVSLIKVKTHFMKKLAK